MHQKSECLKKEIRELLLKEIDLSRDISDEEMYELIDIQLLKQCKELFLTVKEKKLLRIELFHSVRKLDVLQQLVDDPNVTEIMINGKDQIFIEKSGKLQKYEIQFESTEKLEDVIQQIVAKCNRVVNEASPIVDARLDNGARVNVVLDPIALNGPIVTIRRFPDHPITMEQLIKFESISPFLSAYLSCLVQAGYNIFVSGGTGSGKTTFLNALSDSIPNDERIITVEDNAELQILHIPNLVRLEARNANVEGCREITIRDLIRSSLRMRPDRIIVGEVRGSEAIDMIQAMNTGHDGSMSTGHANSSADMLSRLETMILMGMDLPLAAIRRQLASGIDIIVQLGRLRDKSRKILEVCEITGKISKDTGEIEIRPLFVFTETEQKENEKVKGEWRKENELQNMAKLKAAGILLPSECV